MKLRELLATLQLAVVVGAWSTVHASDTISVTGFGDRAAGEQLALEERFVSNLEASRLRESMREPSAKPHHTGSPGGRAVAESIARKFQSWGFESRIETFYALMRAMQLRFMRMPKPQVKFGEHPS